MIPSTLLLTALLLQTDANEAGELRPPVPVLSSGKPIDVELEGYAAPFVYDFDEDGKRDLIVGEEYGGRSRIYRNVGTDSEPRFDGFTLFQDGSFEGSVREFNAWSVGPQFVDLNGDGLDDMVTGGPFGDIFFFPRLDRDRFAAPRKLKGHDGNPIRIGSRMATFVADWDDDGHNDIVVGNRDGVFLFRNAGPAGEINLQEHVPLVCEAGEIVVPGNYGSPVVADWDGDGLLDLLVGAGDGSVSWYRNKGSRTKPLLAKTQTLVAAPKKEEPRGDRARICVTDWNLDGRPDLLLGDFGGRFEKKLTEQDNQEKARRKQEQSRLLKEWAGVYRQVKTMSSQKADSEAKAKILAARLRDLKATLAGINRKREFAQRSELAIKPGLQYHGRVWLFLRKGD